MTATFAPAIDIQSMSAPTNLAAFLASFGIHQTDSYESAKQVPPMTRTVRDALRRRVNAVAEAPTARRQRSLYAFASSQGVIGRVHSIKADAIRASGEAVAATLRDLPEGARILDLGCNTGHLTLWYAHQFPHLEVVGCDFVPEAIDHARRVAAERGITNVRFEVADLTSGLPEGPFDVVTSTQGITSVDGDRAAVLARVAGVLRPTGRLVGVEILGTASAAAAFIANAAVAGLALVGMSMAPFDDGFVPGAYPVLDFRVGATRAEVDLDGLYAAALADLRHRHFLALGWTEEEIAENRAIRAARGECAGCGGCGD
jgi:2-polyprenyl-3-methyl-5-hydroxy-6-metoxy-1,4-benzoquinol methylase